MSCENCKLRAKYDANPRSLLGRFWRWHIRFCPGWKRYLKKLPPREREAVEARYALTVSSESKSESGD